MLCSAWVFWIKYAFQGSYFRASDDDLKLLDLLDQDCFWELHFTTPEDDLELLILVEHCCSLGVVFQSSRKSSEGPGCLESSLPSRNCIAKHHPKQMTI